MPVLSTALYERFSSRGDADYQDKLLSAMRYQFGGAQYGVEDDDMNIMCMGGRVVGAAAARDLVDTFLAAKFTQAERHVRRLRKVASLECQSINQ